MEHVIYSSFQYRRVSSEDSLFLLYHLPYSRKSTISYSQYHLLILQLLLQQNLHNFLPIPNIPRSSSNNRILNLNTLIP